MLQPVTASMLYDLVMCPHRPTMDLYADLKDRDEISPFVRLLWEKGALYEEEVMAGQEIPFLDLSKYPPRENVRLTHEAMERKEPLIYAGRIEAKDLAGIPDLLRLKGDLYVPGDIKSGAGLEGQGEDKKPKKHYVVQLALYVDILEQKGFSGGRRGFIWDIHGDEVPYDLKAPQGPRTPQSFWDEYQSALNLAQNILSGSSPTFPAYGAPCKLCHWYSACLSEMEAKGDISLIPELGRARKEALMGEFPTIRELAECDMSPFIHGKETAFPKIGPDMLFRFQERARLISEDDPKPYLKETVQFPEAEVEIFFDIETDPLHDDFCYLHGFVERKGGEGGAEQYIYFFCDELDPKSEEASFSKAVNYLRKYPSSAIYYYSKYERTIWRKLSEKYPDVCSVDEVNALLDPPKGMDLYFDVVRPKTEWPTRDFSIKMLATYLGFGWRDPNPSGATSIEWYHRWIESKDPHIRQRILEYNEDDCRATRVLLDGLCHLSKAL